MSSEGERVRHLRMAARRLIDILTVGSEVDAIARVPECDQKELETAVASVATALRAYYA